jgi:hypothetical protein
MSARENGNEDWPGSEETTGTPFPGEGESAPEASDPQADALDRTAERWARRQRRQRRWIAMLAAMLGVISLVFLTVNAVFILWQQPDDYSIVLQADLGDGNQAGYVPRLRWRPPDQAASGHEALVRPQVVIDGRPLHEAGASAQGTPLLKLNRTYRLQVVIPDHCSAGAHQGILRLEPSPPDADLPEREIPIEVEVVRSIWRNWFLVRNWALIALAISIAAYLLCLVLFPRAQEALLFSLPAGMGPDVSKHVALRPSRWSLLFPWLRPYVRWSWIVRRLGWRRLPTLHGGLEFTMRHLPPLFHAIVPPESKLEYRYSRSNRLDYRSKRYPFRTRMMDPQLQFILSHEDHAESSTDAVLFRFAPESSSLPE